MLARQLGLKRVMPGVVARLETVLSWRRFGRQALRQAAADPAGVWFAHDLDTLPVAARARRRHGGTLIYDSHELFLDRTLHHPQPRLVRSWWRRTEARLIHEADHVFVPVPSRAWVLARRYGIDPPTVIMNVPPYSPPPAARSGAIRGRLGLGDQPLVLYLGVIYRARRDGLLMLIESVPHLSPDTQLVMVGPSDMSTRSDLNGVANRLGIEDRVHLLPAVHPDEIREQAADADVGVVPFLNRGLNNYHSLPTKIFDYLGAGIPVATSDFPDMAELIESYDVGATFDPERPASIAAAIESIVADPDRRSRLSANAAEAAKQFRWEDQAARLLAAVDGTHAGGA
jgi:glycosyltransferase involved in cell wall biosynthesis